MGKRELLIICAFVVVGAVVYQLTAPARKPGERGFSISKMFSGIRKEISANASSASITKTGTIPVSAAMTELRVYTARSVPLTIVGEKRDDISYEMPVESTGPDEATAREWANLTKLLQDDLGAALALTTYFPEQGTQNARLTLRVPAKLAVRVENSGRIEVSQVAAVELRNLSGEATISHAGAVTGSHRSGDLTVTGAETVNVALTSSRAKIRGVSQAVTLNARSGECWIAESTGPITAVLSNAELVIDSFKNTIKVTGDGGQIKVLNAQNTLSIDVRRMLVEVETLAGAGDEFTIITTEEPLRVSLAAEASATIDAVTVNGKIRASEFGFEPTTEARETRLKSTLGKGGAHIVLRNSRGDIVIGKRK